MNIAIIVAGLAALAATPAEAAPISMDSSQAKAYFAKASTTAEGLFGGKPSVAVLFPNAESTSSRLEIWSRSGDGYQRLALAPKAGCSQCSGPSAKPNPVKMDFVDDSLNVEYQGGGSGLGFWAWRSTWGWDPLLSTTRAVATQRLGSDDHGFPRHSMVSFISGERFARKSSPQGISASHCRADIGKPPSFSALSLDAFFDGALDPRCQSGSELDDALDDGEAGGSLDNLMRPSAPAKSK